MAAAALLQLLWSESVSRQVPTSSCNKPWCCRYAGVEPAVAVFGRVTASSRLAELLLCTAALNRQTPEAAGAARRASPIGWLQSAAILSRPSCFLAAFTEARMTMQKLRCAELLTLRRWDVIYGQMLVVMRQHATFSEHRRRTTAAAPTNASRRQIIWYLCIGSGRLMATIPCVQSAWRVPVNYCDPVVQSSYVYYCIVYGYL